MKRRFLLACVCLLTLQSAFLKAQSKFIDIGIFNAPSGSNKLEIRIKPTINVTDKPLSAGIFTVRFRDDYNVSLSVLSSIYGFAIAEVAQNINDGGIVYDYYAFSFVQGFTVSYTPP